MRLGDEAIVAGDPVAFDDFRELAQDVGDVCELAGQRPDAQPCGDRQPDPRRVDPDRIAFDHAAFLEPP